MKERLKADQPHTVIELVAAGAGFTLVPSSVQEYERKRIVCRRLDPAPPELELSLARVRGVESPAMNALLEAARQVVGPPKSHVSGENGADSPSGGSEPSGVSVGLAAAKHLAPPHQWPSPRREIVDPRRPSAGAKRQEQVDLHNSGGDVRVTAAS